MSSPAAVHDRAFEVSAGNTPIVMRVLHLGAGNLYGGVETFLVTLARCQSLSNMHSAFGLTFEGRLAGELRATGVDVYGLGEVRLSRPWTTSRARRNLRKVLASDVFDVVVCHGAWAHAVFGRTIIRARRPLVYWAHNPPSREWVDRYACRVPPDLVVANSHFTLAELQGVFSHSRKTVLRYPVPSEPSDENAAVGRRALRRELDTRDDDVVLVCSSRLEAWKGHRLLLDALAAISDLPGWVAWIAGGPQRETERIYLTELVRAVSDRGLERRVRFIGERSDIPKVLRAADIHCQPNTGPEPFGIAFVEALGACLPVVTCAIGAALEIVTPECGILVAPEPRYLAAALRKLVQDRDMRLKLSAGAPARASALCDPTTALGAIEWELSRVSAR